MSIINFSPNRQYLYSPITFIHQIAIKNKIYFILFYLLFIPLFPQITILLFFVYVCILNELYKYLQLKLKYINKILKILSFYITIIMLIFIISNTIKNTNHKYLTIILPCIIKYNSCFIICFNYYFLSLFLIHTLIFIYHTTYFLFIVFLTTKLERIILIFLNITSHLIKYNNTFKILLIFSCSLSTRFLSIIFNQLKDYYYHQKIKKMNNKSYSTYLYFYLFFIDRIIYKIKTIAYTLYNREIRKYQFYLTSI